MPQQRLLAFLQSTGLMGAAQAAEIAGSFAPKALAKNELLLQAGQVSDAYYFLDQGVLRAFAYDVDGNDVTTDFYTGGQVVFEVSSFFTRTPSQENMQALTDCAGWCLTYAQLNALFHARPEFREFGRSVLVRGFAALKSRMLTTITAPAAERYEALVRDSPAVLQHAPLRTVASYLGVTDSSLSRIRKGELRK